MIARTTAITPRDTTPGINKSIHRGMSSIPSGSAKWVENAAFQLTSLGWRSGWRPDCFQGCDKLTDAASRLSGTPGRFDALRGDWLLWEIERRLGRDVVRPTYASVVELGFEPNARRPTMPAMPRVTPASRTQGATGDQGRHYLTLKARPKNGRAPAIFGKDHDIGVLTL